MRSLTLSLSHTLTLSRSHSGFTLIELILVLAIVVIIAVMAYPSLYSMYGDLRQTQATDKVRAAWAQARVQAVNEGRPYRFAVVPGKGNYRVAPEGGEFWSGGSSNLASSAQGTERLLVIEDAIPKGVRFALPDDGGPADRNAADDTVLPGPVEPGRYVHVVTFLPDGTCREDVNITFLSNGARPMLLKLRGITGAVTLQPLPENGQQ